MAVVSWNTRGLLERCLRSLAPDVDAGRIDVCVVDNASTDNSPAAARALAPRAEVIEAGRNLGFGAAANLAARRSQSPWLAVANADIALERGALEALLDAGSDPTVGCVAPRLILPDGTTQHSVYPFPTVSFTLAFNASLHRLRPGLGDRLCLEGYWDPERPRAVDWAIGALLLLRREAFEAVGGFDERQWMYAEDLDLGWRLSEAGWATRYEPRARVLHDASAATSLAFGDQKTERFMSATYAVLARRRGHLRALATAGINFAGAAARVGWMAPLALVGPRRREGLDLNRRWAAVHLRALRRLIRV